MKNLKVFCLALILLLTTTRCQESETEDAFGGEDTDECEDYQNLGLWTFNGDSLNLLSLSTNVYIEGPYALVEHTLVYDNSFTDDRNYIFYFNKPTAAIVNNISATWNNREVDAWLIAKDEAEEIYDDFSAEEQSVDIDLRDVPAFVVGRVPAGRAITITYETIQPLTLVANKYWGFSMYASLSPKDVFRTREWNSTPDYEETILQGGEINDWNVSVNISSRRGMDRTISPNYVFEPRNQEIGNRTYTWWEGTINTNRDFIIFFTSERVHTPTYVLTRHPTYAQDYILGYALVVEGDGRTLEDVSREIQNANSIVEVDANVNETAILRDIRTSCWCNNSAGEIIFRAESDDDSWRRGQAYEKYFYLRNLQNPQGCRLNFTYVNTYTRATHTRSFTFRGFELARTTDEWHKIAYEDRIEDLREENEDDDDNEGDNEDGDNTDALIDELALRYQLKNEDNVWVTVDNNNNRTILDDSVKYHFAPEVEEEAEAGQNEEGNAEDGEVIGVIEVEDDTEDLGGDAGEGQGDDVEDGQGDDGAQDDNFEEEAAPEEEDTGTVVVITPVEIDGQASNDENQGENNEENEEDQGGYY